MHELSIALSILDIAGQEAERQGGGRVVAIHLRLGPLSGVVKDALLSSYNLAREHTGLAAATLVIEETPLVAYCPTCAAPRTLPTPWLLTCPVCGTLTPDVQSGRELEVVALEVEA
jgi:hydrogenase nickel incorporation protein HypA/HybF